MYHKVLCGSARDFVFGFRVLVLDVGLRTLFNQRSHVYAFLRFFNAFLRFFAHGIMLDVVGVRSVCMC